MLKLLSFLPASWATMELNNVFDSTNYSIEAVPRGSENKFGYLAPMNIFHLPPTGLELKIPFEGMNEVGLTVSGLLLTESIYERPEPGKKHLSAEDVIPALLANCSSVDGAIEMLESVNVVAPSLQALDGEGLHWAIADATGRSIIVEYLQGKRMILENHPRVMTNDPDIKWHWRNLNTHVNLSPNYPVEANSSLRVQTHGEIHSVTWNELIGVLRAYPSFREEFISHLELAYNLGTEAEEQEVFLFPNDAQPPSPRLSNARSTFSSRFTMDRLERSGSPTLFVNGKIPQVPNSSEADLRSGKNVGGMEPRINVQTASVNPANPTVASVAQVNCSHVAEFVFIEKRLAQLETRLSAMEERLTGNFETILHYLRPKGRSAPELRDTII